MTLLGLSLTLRSLCILSLDESEEAVSGLELGSPKVSAPGKEALMEPQKLKGETTVPSPSPMCQQAVLTASSIQSGLRSLSVEFLGDLYILL